MTTLRQIKNLAMPLIERHRDLVLVGQMIVVKPVRHVLRYIFIDRTSEADRPNPRWSLTDLLCKIEQTPIGLGELLYRRDAGGDQNALWAWSDPRISQAFIDVAERVAKLRAIETLHDFRNFVLPKDPAQWKHYWGDRLRCGLALGRLDEVRQLLVEAPDGVAMLNRNRRGLGTKLLALGPRISADDRTEIAGLLREWEARSVAKLKIGHLWERTPFPVEFQTGGSAS